MARYEPGTYVLRREVRRVSDDKLILHSTDAPVILTAPGPGGTWELPSPLPSFMCPTPIGVAVRDEPVRFIVTLLDHDAAKVLTTVTAIATPRCPPDGDLQHTFCVQICSG